ncbi:MAG: PD-(D/E)XK nuclease family protein [Ruthenibacterium sp.]
MTAFFDISEKIRIASMGAVWYNHKQREKAGGSVLQLILGVSGTGKTRQVFAQMKARAMQGKKSIFLVPEQFTSTAETMVYTAFGDALCAEVNVYSFTSFAEEILKQYGGTALKTLTDAGRVVLVRRALDSLGDTLETYHRHRRNIGFCSMCADAIKELKTAGATGETLVSVAQKLGNDGIKLRELGLIFAAYDALLAGNAMDSADRVSVAAQRMQPEYLADKAVFIDNFDGFTAPEYRMLKQIVCAESCTVTLCADTLAEHEGGFGLFSSVRRMAQRLRRIAAGAGVSVETPLLLTQDFRHQNAADLRAVGELLTQGALHSELQRVENICFTPADSLYDECKTVACQMAELAAHGMRYSDMTVICRSMSAYTAPMRYELTLAGVPYFADEATTPEHTAPAAFLRAALALAARGLNSELILHLLKTDLCGFSAADIATLENYAYTWQLKAADWRVPFTKNPSGFGAQMSAEDSAALDTAERLRKEAIPKIEHFIAASQKQDAAGLSRELYLLLAAFDGDVHTAEAAAELSTHGDETDAAAEYRTWNTSMELLGEMALLLEKDAVTPTEYDELLLLILRATDVGHVPQTQNAAMVTTADRMRLSAPKVCFVLGISEGEFPKTIGFSGLLTHADRELLVENGVEMPGSFENRTLLEQMFFYRALTAPSEKLYLSALRPDVSGVPLSSALVQLQTVLCPPLLVLNPAQKAPTPAAALDLLGTQYRQDTPETAALLAALHTDRQAAKSVEAMEKATHPRPFAAMDTAALEALLGRTMSLSPTRVEQYYRCRFSYFLQYVLRIRPRKKAELSPMESGSLVHYILENALKQAGSNFVELSAEELELLAGTLADAYVAENMPEAGVRFAYLIARLKTGVTRLLSYLQKEQAQSAFHPVAFEQEIGYGEDAVAPLVLHTQDGKTMQLVGKIDRVDCMEREGKQYLRVIDYKTGDKTFQLDEVYCGLNTQMLFYLFTLCKNGKDKFPNPVAAGVLYLAGDPAPKSGSRADAAQPLRYQVDGLVLDDALVIHAMDKAHTGEFVPFSFLKSGAPRASAKLASFEKLGRIEQHLESLVLEMARGLYAGEIDAMPLCTKKFHPCATCDYMPICRHETGRNESYVTAPKQVFEAAETGEKVTL